MDKRERKESVFGDAQNLVILHKIKPRFCASARRSLSLKPNTMKKLLLLASLALSTSLFAQEKKQGTPDKTKSIQTVEAACGQCKLGLPGKTCDLAVRINGKAYFVEGIHIDSLGDAHAKDGFCNAIRKAHVQGEVVKDKFKASYFVLVPEIEKQ